MYQSFVGVHHLFQIDSLVAVVSKGCVAVEVLVGSNDIFSICYGFNNCCTENTSRKIATIGYKVDGGIEAALYLCQRLAYLGNMLMAKSFVDAQVVGTPREMGGGTGLLTQ